MKVFKIFNKNVLIAEGYGESLLSMWSDFCGMSPDDPGYPKFVDDFLKFLTDLYTEVRVDE